LVSPLDFGEDDDISNENWQIAENPAEIGCGLHDLKESLRFAKLCHRAFKSVKPAVQHFGDFEVHKQANWNHSFFRVREEKHPLCEIFIRSENLLTVPHNPNDV
jgi:hypothetical protein